MKFWEARLIFHHPKCLEPIRSQLPRCFHESIDVLSKTRHHIPDCSELMCGACIA